MQGAVDTVMEALMMGVPLARAEFLDSKSINAVRSRSAIDELSFHDRPCLFLEFHGTELQVNEQKSQVKNIAESYGLIGQFLMATREEDRFKLWKARHAALYAIQQVKPDSRCVITDVCVPISKITSCISETLSDTETTGVFGPLFGKHISIP